MRSLLPRERFSPLADEPAVAFAASIAALMKLTFA
jgi:hypothetical protein